MKVKQNRRGFIKTSAAGALGVMALGPLGCTSVAADDKKSYGVGLQLYSIRDAVAEDVPGSLQKVSDMGYKYLELAGYTDGKFYGYAPAEFKKMVNDLGMEILSSHTMVEAAGITLDNARIMADAHAALDAKYCIQPWVEEVDRNIESYKRMIADWNQVGQIMKETGIQFGYHNHNFEFLNIDGIVPYYDLFMTEMDADLITMEIDLYWVTKAGQDPVEMFKKYPGRFQLFHLKDMYEETPPYFDVIKDDISPVGAGKIDFKRIMAEKELAGMKHFFVEDDNQGNGKPFEGIETSINNITGDILA
ncbi:MAG: sugar phosphate isomerase/epimerase [Bacteroidales bacterium]|nr:sugar phosphate isomerase/epimerase [Bacteroidales bacterium]